MKKTKYAFVVLALLIAGALTNAKYVSVALKSSEASLNRNVQRIDDPVELALILTANGFNPNQTELQNGKFLLSVDNRSGANELVLNLSRSDGTLIREMKVAGAGGDWNEAFDLPAGSYQLREANHSSWTCAIMIH